ncbi:MAG: hypothetical protein Q4G45_07865 [Actinomycetia bacterium]|jgi:hypothetical protein|nr:hypothetical protein [Actinomycetes bacterium]
MGLQELPEDVRYRVTFFDSAGDKWAEVAQTMRTTHTTLSTGKRIPPFSQRIPQNLRSFGEAANKAFDAYLGALDKGATCADSVGSTLRASGLAYLRQEQYSEELVQEIEKELNQ